MAATRSRINLPSDQRYVATIGGIAIELMLGDLA
jgi:hypothetical protein